jgi:hypothetical protein
MKTKTESKTRIAPQLHIARRCRTTYQNGPNSRHYRSTSNTSFRFENGEQVGLRPPNR